MLKNYIKVIFRNLLRYKFFSAINIFGLAVAMSVGIVIIMLVADQLTYDSHNVKRDRIYRVTTTRVNPDGSLGQVNASSSLALRNELLNNYTGIEKIVRFRSGFGNDWLELENHDVNISIAGLYTDPEALDLFQYDLQYGVAATALIKPYSVVLSRQAADRLFKEQNPVGLTIKVGETGTFTARGYSSKQHTNRTSFLMRWRACLRSSRCLGQLLASSSI